jgi:pyrroline-5-carboxylate reductase
MPAMSSNAILGVLGAGNMGEAIVRGAIRQGVLAPEQILVAEVDEARRAMMAGLGCQVTAAAGDTVGCEQVMLAVKPQGFPDLAKVMGELPSPTVVMTVMAGLSSGAIRRAMGPNAKVIRVMPNTPCQIGLGMSAIALGEGAEPGDEELATKLFGAIGAVVSVEERHMYAVTAVSGSGPAYIFLLAEAMEQAALDIDLPPDVARQLVRQTVYGAAALLHGSDVSAAERRAAVTSKGGTTHAAIETMKERGLPEAVIAGMRAARDRGIELDG